MSDPSVGVYVHVPFCERVCPYCDFAVVATRQLRRSDEDGYVDALLAELAARRRSAAGRLESVYLGGGTPSLLQPASVARLLEAVAKAFPAAAAPEVTLEVNPSTVERARLPGFLRAGVNRLSLGLQSLDDTVLRRLGRAHRAAEGLDTLCAARDAGFANLSVDLIFGAPDQSVASYLSDLDRVLEAAPEHISTYELTVEEGTPYALAVRRGQLDLPDEDAVLRMMEEGRARLAAAGLHAYELSSYARAGFESVHNRRYWARRRVLGLGMGAWSTEPPSPEAPYGARRANVRDLPVYLTRIAAGESSAAGPAEVLAPATARGEAMFLALRTAAGVDLAAFAREFGAPPGELWPGLADLLREGLLETGSGTLRLTPRGRRIADSVFACFV